MAWVATAVVGGSLIGAGASIYAGNKANNAAKAAAGATTDAAANAEALNRERYGQAQTYMNPYIGRANIASQQLQAEMGLPQYTVDGQPATNTLSPRDMSQIPGYQGVMDQSLQGAEQSAINSGSTLYGGNRLRAAGQVGAGVQQSYYNNYMNLLQNLASPTAATNLSNMGIGQGQVIGQQNIAATNAANNYKLQGVSAQNAGLSDAMGGITNLASGYMSGGAGYTPPAASPYTPFQASRL